MSHHISHWALFAYGLWTGCFLTCVAMALLWIWLDRTPSEAVAHDEHESGGIG